MEIVMAVKLSSWSLTISYEDQKDRDYLMQYQYD